MADDILSLASPFPEATHDDWLAAVDKVLRGKSFDKVLRTSLADDITIEPLYTADPARAAIDAVPAGASRRASNAAGTTEGWDVRQRHAHLGDTAATNAAILHDLERGVTSIELDTAGIDDADTLEAVLDAVLFDLAPIALRSKGDGLAGAQMFLDVLARRDIRADTALGSLGCDPIGQLAENGSIGTSIDQAIVDVASLSARVAQQHPAITSVQVDGTPYGHGGASPATEVAAMLATGVAYLRALTDAGLSPTDAFGQIELHTSVGTDQFTEIAKIRALRTAWARIAEASGAAGAPCRIRATTSAAVLTQFDPWVNLLRCTTACFAAAVAGADIISVRPFDTLAGVPDALGLRLARNTQLVLMEESNLHRVVDPAGGSWYVEQLTDELAERAWNKFQTIEADGGIVAVLQAGSLQADIASTWAETSTQVATRRREIIGVSVFPDLDELAVQRPGYPATSGVPGVAEANEVTTVEAIPVRRLAADFEALRVAAEAAAEPPAVFAANLGTPAQFTARASWAKNFFDAGGIRCVGDDGYDDAAAAAAAFTASSAKLAVICSSDDLYLERGVDTAAALVAAGATHVYMAGHPGDHRDERSAAGVGTFIHVGCDALEILQAAHRSLGIEPGGQPS